MIAPRQQVVLGLLLVLAPGVAIADKTNAEKAPANPEPRYRMPAIMVITHVDWPEQAEHRDTMAKFVADKGFTGVEVEMEMLDVLRKHGLYARLGGDLGKMVGAAEKLKDDPAVFAYFVSDRKRKSSFPGFADWARLFEKFDPNHPTMFINRALWNEMGEFVKIVKPKLLDYYHYHWQPRRRGEWHYFFLMVTRALGQENGIPVMRCVDAGRSPGQIRQTMYTSLAYGVQGFHFWPPWHIGHQKNDKGEPVLKDGKVVPTITPWGETIASVCADLRSMGPILLKSRSVGVYHVDPVLVGCQKVKDDSWFEPSGKHVVVGHFEDPEGHDYLLVVNGDAGTKREATLRFMPRATNLQRLDPKDGKWKALETTTEAGRTSVKLEIEPGTGRMLKVDVAEAPAKPAANSKESGSQ